MYSMTPEAWRRLGVTISDYWARMAAGGAVESIPVDDRCVNEGGQRRDGSYCFDRAEANGWCVECARELFGATP